MQWLLPVVGAVVAALAVMMLSFGVRFGTDDSGPCPQRLSRVLTAGEQSLRVRAERVTGGQVLLHLCAESDTEMVRRWSVTVDGAVVPVQPVGDRLALAATSVTGGTARLTVVTWLTSGVSAEFGARI